MENDSNVGSNSVSSENTGHGRLNESSPSSMKKLKPSAGSGLNSEGHNTTNAATSSRSNANPSVRFQESGELSSAKKSKTTLTDNYASWRKSFNGFSKNPAKNRKKTSLSARFMESLSESQKQMLLADSEASSTSDQSQGIDDESGRESGRDEELGGDENSESGDSDLGYHDLRNTADAKEKFERILRNVFIP